MIRTPSHQSLSQHGQSCWAGLALAGLAVAGASRGLVFQLIVYLTPLAALAGAGTRASMGPVLRAQRWFVGAFFLALLTACLWGTLEGRAILWGDLFKIGWKLVLLPAALAALLAVCLEPRTVCCAWLVGTSLVALGGLYQLAGLVWEGVEPAGWGRLTGFARNPNPYGLIAALGTVGVVLGWRMRYYRAWITLSLLLVTSSGVLLSGSRGALAAMVFGAVLVRVLSRRDAGQGFHARPGRVRDTQWHLWSWQGLAGFGAGALLMLLAWFSPLAHRLMAGGVSSPARWSLWSDYLGLVRKNGLGLGLVELDTQIGGPLRLDPHNLFLETLLVGGVPALVALMAALGAVAWISWRERIPEAAFLGSVLLYAQFDMSLFDSIPMEAALGASLAMFWYGWLMMVKRPAGGDW